jgi:ATP-dependent Clp protease adaptor protein ClpS|tara:strand:- start:4111 stop:4419 length:309 start_codon:yes stop_codon:yes gene_type:complete
MEQSESQSQSELTHTRLRGPSKYNVIFLNDDATSIEFVISVLAGIFHKDKIEAEAIAAHIHEKGKAIAGTYIYEVAEQKVTETVSNARVAGFPLSLTLEEVE